jgi:LysM repeat protein
VLALLVALPLAAAAVFGGIGAVGATATDTAGTDSFSYVTVQQGESLWQLAQQVAPSADPRDVVADIARLNNLSSGVIQPGQRIAIPAQYAR